MKKYSYLLLTSLLVSVFSFSTYAQIDPKSVSWNELADFQTLFAATYHPAKTGNFEPIHSKADSLSQAGMKLQKSAPAVFSSPEMTKTLSDLQKHTDKILAAVKANTKDEALTPQLEDINKDLEKVKSICSKKIKGQQ